MVATTKTYQEWSYGTLNMHDHAGVHSFTIYPSNTVQLILPRARSRDRRGISNATIYPNLRP